MTNRWTIHFLKKNGQLIQTDTENKLQEIKEKTAAQKRAEQAEKQNERLVAQLPALGIEPDVH